MAPSGCSPANTVPIPAGFSGWVSAGTLPSATVGPVGPASSAGRDAAGPPTRSASRASASVTSAPGSASVATAVPAGTVELGRPGQPKNETGERAPTRPTGAAALSSAVDNSGT